MIRPQENEICKKANCSCSVRERFLLSRPTICAFLLMTCTAFQHAAAQPENGIPVIDNERVTVWDMTLKPGQPVSMEHRDNDFVTLFLVGGEIRTTGADGRTSIASREFGDSIYEPKGTNEKEEVMSHSPARLILVELKNHPVPALSNKSGYPLAFPRPGSRKVFENDKIIVWNYAYRLGVPTLMHYHDKDALVVYKENGSIKSTTPDGQSIVTDDKSGEVKFSKRDRIHFEELVKGQETVIVMELK